MVYLFNFYWRNVVDVGRNVLETTQLCLMEPPQVKHIQTNPTQFLDSTIIELKILPLWPRNLDRNLVFPYLFFYDTTFSCAYRTPPHSLLFTTSSSLSLSLSLSHRDLSPTWQIKFHHFNSSTSNSSPTLNVWKPSFLM